MRQNTVSAYPENSIFSSNSYDVSTRNNARANSFQLTLDLIYNIESPQGLVGDCISLCRVVWSGLDQN
jgi:hypothetical protein